MANRFLVSPPPTLDNPRLDSGTPSADELPAFAAMLLASVAAETDRAERAKAAPMAPAPFVWREDGRPDWATMWGSFCELALYGGPPHRPAEEAVVTDNTPLDPNAPSIAEMRRGIWETAHLFSEPAEPGWLAIRCDTSEMAAWLCKAIALENVAARTDGMRLLVPASDRFELQGEVKSVITVVAKTVHYWEAHIAGL